jgi:hypothetical protein
VAVEPDPSQCGRNLLRVRSLEGRAEKVLRLGGVTIHPLQFAIVTARPAVEVETVEALERSPGGKLRMIVAAAESEPPAR